MRVWRAMGVLGVTAGLLLSGLTGTASAAEAAEQQSCAPSTSTPLRQFRASWISSVVNIDWPSKTGLSAAQQQAELIGWLDDAVRQHHNAVILQVRPIADAFWPSKVEPWSQYLTGHQGGDPGYDPLKFAVTEAHKRNLELHAWFNPYRLSMGTDLNALVPTHPARLHPDWVVSYGGKLYYNPGIPAVRAFIEDAIMDAVSVFIWTLQRATARRWVASLGVTSTIRARPSGSRCVNSKGGMATSVRRDPAGRRGRLGVLRPAHLGLSGSPTG